MRLFFKTRNIEEGWTEVTFDEEDKKEMDRIIHERKVVSDYKWEAYCYYIKKEDGEIIYLN